MQDVGQGAEVAVERDERPALAPAVPGSDILLDTRAAALLSGDRMTFDALRCEAPELRQLPVATYVWFEKNYLDRDYPLRFVLRCNGVQFPETLKKEP